MGSIMNGKLHAFCSASHTRLGVAHCTISTGAQHLVKLVQVRNTLYN